jgi:hypothetical protein
LSVIQSLLTCFDDYIDTTPVPAAEAQEALLVLLRNGEADRFLEIMKGNPERNRELIEAFKRTYSERAAWFEEQTHDICSELRSEYLQTARRKLSSLTEFVLVDAVERSHAEKMNLLADTNHQLLEISVAHEFISRLPNGLNRAQQLSEWAVKEPSSEKADLYLAEACNCFLFGFDTSCVVMCRSLLEEVLERKLPDSILSGAKRSNSKGWTLGSLLDVVNNNLTESGISRDVPVLVRKINEIGSTAAHQSPVSPQEALDCLKKTRAAILRLL